MHPEDLKRFKQIRKELEAKHTAESEKHACDLLRSVADALPPTMTLAILRRPAAPSWLLFVANEDDRLQLPILACPWCNTLLDPPELLTMPTGKPS
jgi:hypothetical protein